MNMSMIIMALKMSDRELSLIMMRAPWGLFVVDIRP